MLEFAFMQRGLLAAVLVGLVCGVLGFFVVLRRLAFIGVGIAHSAVGGVAIGILIGMSPLLTAGVFAVAVALGIASASRRGRLSEDAVIGVFLSAAMALGLVLFSMERGYQQDLFGYLFGNVLAISAPELAVLAAATVAILGVLSVTFKQLLFIAFDEEVAKAYGQPVDGLNTMLLVLLAVAIVVGVRLVGILLIEALLVVPAATAVLWASNFRAQVAISAGLGMASGVIGLVAAYRFNVAAGGSIVLVTVAVFFGSLLVRGGRST
jgi:ABC-type Mn2+/Zn2+ transport system permease subunit